VAKIVTKPEMPKNGSADPRLKAGYTLVALVVIACGLLLRRFGYSIDLPFIVVNYGAAVLWGAMVYLLLAALLAPRVRPPVIAGIAAAIAVALELFRLYHTPWLDAFRLTLAGALLIGRIFSIWNIVSYALGIALAYRADLMLAVARR
jgi:hypothetical protein